MIAKFLNMLHLVFLFLPMIIYLIPIKYFTNIFKYGMLVLIITPLHWIFFENQCILTIFTKRIGDFSNKNNIQTTSPFSEKYLKWLYKPIMNVIGWKWETGGIDKMVNLHMITNFILVWYYLFFIGKCKLI